MHPGKRLQHYILIEQVGQGGQAAVWSAEDELLKRTVAIKTINLRDSSAEPSMGSLEQQAQRFVNEARTIADLEHPYILPVYTYGQEGDWLYIVMRYMAGGTLRKLIGKEGMPIEDVVRLSEPLADALDQAHQRQIVHRDIKSVNVLLDAQRRPYLADFGLSVTVGDPSSQSGSGTLAYMSPEQLRGDMADHRSDLYSFGILVYEMLTGSTPEFNGGHWNLSQLMSGTALPMPASVPPAAADILRSATALSPTDRYPSAMAMIHALKETIQTAQPADPFVLTLDSSGGATDFGLELLPINDPALIALNKANDLFNTALNDWADGAGRFRLYSDDFKFIESFYAASENWDMALTESGQRLMLRAALEHDYKIDYWWNVVSSTADRRSVALQTLSSELPSARLRAIEYLTLIEDSDPPAIPIRVATIVSREPEAEVRLAGVILLEERATQAKGWRDYAYNSIIDDVLADLASKDADPRVLEAAAHAIGHIRSSHAVRVVAERASEDPRAMIALTQVRDEAPTFPTGIAAPIRRRALFRLALRQMLERPLELVWRYLSIVLGFTLGLGLFVYSTLYVQGASALGLGVLMNAVLNVGVTYGALFALSVFVALEPARRLRVFGRSVRIGLPLLLGGLLSIAMFTVFRTTYNNIVEPVTTPLNFYLPAFILPAGFAVAAAFTRKPVWTSLAGALSVFLAVFGNYALCMIEAGRNGDAASGYSFTDYLFYLDPLNGLRSVGYGLLIAGAVGFLTFVPEWVETIRRWSRTVRL